MNVVERTRRDRVADGSRLHRFCDETLVQMAQRGSGEAFGELWNRHRGWIRRHLSG